jgi:hypothetical protein
MDTHKLRQSWTPINEGMGVHDWFSMIGSPFFLLPFFTLPILFFLALSFIVFFQTLAKAIVSLTR